MEHFTQGSGRLIVTVDNTTVDVARAIHALSAADLLRLKALARLWTRGLQDALAWSDVLHEAIARALGGARRWPPGVPIVAFLCGIMRSICEDHWRRARREGRLIAREEDVADLGGEDATSDPERTLAAAQALAAVNELFAGDGAALKVIAGLADGLSPPEICRLYGLTEREYDTTRRRMRRALLRHGLAGSET